jgi:hypothetical protein
MTASYHLLSIRLLVDAVSFNASFFQATKGAWFTSLWTLQELALHKEFMGVLSKRLLIVPPFDLHAAARQLVYLWSLEFEHAH